MTISHCDDLMEDAGDKGAQIPVLVNIVIVLLIAKYNHHSQ